MATTRRVFLKLALVAAGARHAWVALRPWPGCVGMVGLDAGALQSGLRAAPEVNEAA